MQAIGGILLLILLFFGLVHNCGPDAPEGLKQMNQQAASIVGGIFYFLMTWVPLPVYYASLFERIFINQDKIVRHAAAIAIGLVAPFFFAYIIMNTTTAWSGGFFLVFYSGVMPLVALALNEQQKEQAQNLAREAARRVEEERQRFQNNYNALPSSESYADQFFEDLRAACLEEGLAPIPSTTNLYHNVAKELFEQNIRSPTGSDLSRYSDVPSLISAFSKPLIAAILEFRRLVPQSGGSLQVPAHDVMDLHALHKVLYTFTGSTELAKRAYPNLHGLLRTNWDNYSRQKLSNREYETGRRIFPNEFEGSVRDAVTVYFAHSPLHWLFTAPVSIDLSGDIRFEHQWVIGTTGSGKTQLIQSQIARDLEAVKRGEASLIIIDSKGMQPDKILSKISRLKVFAPGEPLDGKLVLLQPDMSAPGSHQTMPPSLSIFDVGQRDSTLTGRERDILETSALEMITSALSDTTGPQRELIEFLVQLCMAIPNATLDTMSEIIETPPKDFEKKYDEPLSRLPPGVRRYLRSSLTTGGDLTRQAVVRRIGAMVRHKTFRRMYEGQRNMFNMERELEAGKVILINTDRALLGADHCSTFGRYFISLLLQATFQRTSKKPVYCYIDECQDYIAEDERITELFDKARDQKVALILAHQRMSQIKRENVLDALSTCAIRFGSCEAKDGRTLSNYLRADPEMLLAMPKYHFATFIKGMTPHALSIKSPHNVIEDMPTMSDGEYAVICQHMRDLYCSPLRDSSSPNSAPAPNSPTRPGGPVTDVDFEEVIH